MIRRRAATWAAVCAAAVVVLGGPLLGPAQVATADGAHGGGTSDYRVEIVGVDGAAGGVEVEVIELGDRMELRRTTASEVVVLGYEGEPYLKLDASGVWENVLSPAVSLNRDRFARTSPPETADATAPPSWRRMSTSTTVRWHDHRAHWMARIPPQTVSADPSREHVVIPAGEVPLIVDGRPLTIIVRVTWVPPPSRTAWLLTGALVAIVLAAVLVRRDAQRAAAGVLAVAVAAFALTEVVTPRSAALAVGLAAVVAAAIAVSRPDALALASACVVGAALLRLPVVEHPVVRGPLDATGMRVLLCTCLAGGAAAAIASSVAAFRPTR